MLSCRKEKLNTEENTSQSYAFDQKNVIAHSADKEGMCGPLTTLFLHNLFLHGSIENFKYPNYLELHARSKSIERKMIALEKDGGDGDNYFFEKHKLKTKINLASVETLPAKLKDANLALLKYPTLSGSTHQLAFGRYQNKCVLFEPNTAVKVMPCDAVLKNLQEIIAASKPQHIKVTSNI